MSLINRYQRGRLLEVPGVVGFCTCWLGIAVSVDVPCVGRSGVSNKSAGISGNGDDADALKGDRSSSRNGEKAALSASAPNGNGDCC